MSIPDYVSWKEELSVGIQEIDEQHKCLIELINELNAAMLARRGQESVDQALDKLIEYTRTHFVVEESLMRILGYPIAEYEAHKRHHEDLIQQVLEFKYQLVGEGKVSRQELMEFLRNWLINHIMKEDQNYSEHFLKHGAQRSWLKPGWFRKIW
ncbi:hypothetical protein CAI21_04900 [Alkalilimnicola ehrlichii]|uniref:Hemerythrin-like domain-containing protein n=1 Tax=Alkalilimnicola ehrlichii TaxID=351052 RepID=A0A3E0X0M6_9GAMM|nr:bacteriohemerythrin [Alkalilimnicola ehrlichii]RFA30418.1 hypothetical protein CAI21_04900 [Alkalilimnicola ehrlichii]RFA37971.1 hypothetical protein CAL65_06275 [Alkalilimnicola ehrlichii]